MPLSRIFFVSFLFYHDRVAHARTMCGVVYSHAHHRVGTAPLACQRGLMVIVPRSRYACTPTEVHTYPDRGTHASRPRYAHIPTETRRPVSPNNLSSSIKKGTALFKAVPFFCSILSLFYPSLAMRLMSSRLLATGSEVSKPGRNMPCWRMLSSRARSGFQKPPML